MQGGFCERSCRFILLRVELYQVFFPVVLVSLPVPSFLPTIPFILFELVAVGHLLVASDIED